MIGSRDKAELARSKSLLGQFDVAWLTEADSKLALELVAKYKLISGLGFADFHIAAQALNRSATLFTFNLKHFSVIEGLDAQAPFVR